MFYNVVSNEYLSRLSFFLLLFERMNGISANRRAEGQVQCQFTDIISYWLNENRMLKIHVQYLKSRIFDEVHLKICFIR